MTAKEDNSPSVIALTPYKITLADYSVAW